MHSLNFSEYIVFVDESGDHGLKTFDPHYPIFVLVFIIVKKSDYIHKIVPSMQAFKFKYWGHDQVILHENDIRKEKGDFAFLMTNKKLREQFYDDLANLVKEANFEIIAITVDKTSLDSTHPKDNIYDFSFGYCSAILDFSLSQRERASLTTNIIVESRGTIEDKHFYERSVNQISILNQEIKNLKKINLRIVDKKSNSTGLQLADLVARPLGLNYLKPQQANRAFKIIESKILVNHVL